jgi:hypothetical protein
VGGAGAGDGCEGALEGGSAADEERGGWARGWGIGGGERAGGFDERGDGGLELAEVERFDHVVGGTGFAGGDGVIEVAVGGDDEDGEVREVAADGGEDVEPAEVGEADIEDDGVPWVGGETVEGGAAAGGGVEGVAGAAEGDFEGRGEGRFVFDEEDARGHWSGSQEDGRMGRERATRAPPSGGLETERLPPWAEVTSRATVRPMPMPPSLVEKKGSAQWARATGEKPGPWSRMENTAESLLEVRVTWTVVFSGAAWRAFRRMLESA